MTENKCEMDFSHILSDLIIMATARERENTNSSQQLGPQNKVAC